MFEGDGITTSLFYSASVFIIICCVVLIMGCVCGCRRKVPKNELLGLAGMVKIRNPDDQISNSQLAPYCVEHFNSSKSLLKRINGGGATRSLPDLPVDQKLWSLPSDTADTNSDLYATVEDAGRRQKRGQSEAVQEVVPTAPEDNYTVTPEDSLSPYARLNANIEHPYAQLDEPGEHSYARVGESGSIGGPRPSTSSSPSDSPPSRRSNEGSNSPGTERIAAASAITGAVPANHDLPYMTPPITSQPLAHFSGDSHDSAKGYTSISVREPLSRILVKDPHYSTVSDVDSDDMYAAIEDRGRSENGLVGDYSGSETYARIGPRRCQLTPVAGDASGSDTYARIETAGELPTPGDYATSGSETYAQIGPRHETGVGTCPASDTYAQIAPRQVTPPIEYPASSDMYAQIAPSHARQESWSSASPGSGRKEKREANSPLPQPPSSPLDAMYAKVIKKQRSVVESSSPPLPSVNGEIVDPRYETVENIVDQQSGAHYETVGCDTGTTDPPYERLLPTDLYAQVNKPQAELDKQE